MSPLEKLILNSNQSSPSVLPLVFAAVWIVRHDFAVYTVSSVTIGQYSSNSKNLYLQNDLINRLLKDTMNPYGIIKYLVEGEIYPYEEYDDTVSHKDAMDRFFKYYANREKSIWFLDSLKAYLKFEENLLKPNRGYHRNGFFIIIYTGFEAERLVTIRNIFSRLFYLYVVNVNVMMMVGKYAYVYTYYPFTARKCHSPQPELLFSFRGIESNPNFTLKNGLFPNKVTNMHGCPLSLVSWTYAPYVYVEKDPHTGTFIKIHGIEGSIISLLSQQMNFSIYIKEPDPLDVGEIFTNGTSTGAAKMLSEM
ncbi:uncharacterized protein LOC133337324 [Musca vetustissima]|uniref:uncharacterized protein LOC133337324 n=1 Tax=Musca vetustissima TaxID=27455 RepID=UPI002AB66215|nr:uncharacterized protein LOC133337324 [Musca vetustissima]